jgi:hypothetical protein
MPIESQPLAQAIARDQPSQDVNVHLIVNKCFAGVLRPDPPENGSLLVATLCQGGNFRRRFLSNVEIGEYCWHNLHLNIYVIIIAFWTIKTIFHAKFLFKSLITRKSLYKMNSAAYANDNVAAMQMPPLRNMCRGDIKCKSATFPATPVVPSATPYYDQFEGDRQCERRHFVTRVEGILNASLLHSLLLRCPLGHSHSFSDILWTK